MGEMLGRMPADSPRGAAWLRWAGVRAAACSGLLPGAVVRRWHVGGVVRGGGGRPGGTLGLKVG